MKANRIVFVLLGLLLVIISISGCATQQPAQARRYFWPQLPERPRIEWLNTYSSENDFPKEGFAALMRDIAGEATPVTLKHPLDIRASGNGLVYVSDPGQASVFVFDLKNKLVRAFASAANYVSFEEPTTLALDDVGNIYINDVHKKGILVFSKDEIPVSFISTAQHVTVAGGIAVDNRHKRLLVADSKAHRIVAYSLDGNFLFSFGKRGSEDGEFNYPIPVTINHKGEIVVGDVMNSRVQVFDSEGKFLRKFGSLGDGPAEFQILKFVAVDSDDNVYVTDGRAHHIVIYSSAGEYLLTIGGVYSMSSGGRLAPGGFLMPQGIFLDVNDRMYVVDQLNNRIQIFQYLSDSFLRKNPIEGYRQP